MYGYLLCLGGCRVGVDMISAILEVSSVWFDPSSSQSEIVSFLGHSFPKGVQIEEYGPSPILSSVLLLE